MAFSSLSNLFLGLLMQATVSVWSQYEKEKKMSLLTSSACVMRHTYIKLDCDDVSRQYIIIYLAPDFGLRVRYCGVWPSEPGKTCASRNELS